MIFHNDNDFGPKFFESHMLASTLLLLMAFLPNVFAEEAVDLLREFYVAGNPRAPRPHRPNAPAVRAARGDA